MTLRVGQVAKKLGVTPSTIRRYCELGILPYRLTPSGQRIFEERDVTHLLHDDHCEHKDVTAYYVRASDGNPESLAHQIQELKDAYGDGDHIRIYTDKASGLNEKRKGLQNLIRDAEKGRIQHVRITYKDRLTRFGYTYIEHILNTAGVDVEALHNKQQTPSEELMEDFMKLIASFSGRFYQMRSTQNQQRLLQDAQTRLEEKARENGSA